MSIDLSVLAKFNKYYTIFTSISYFLYIKNIPFSRVRNQLIYLVNNSLSSVIISHYFAYVVYILRIMSTEFVEESLIWIWKIIWLVSLLSYYFYDVRFYSVFKVNVSSLSLHPPFQWRRRFYDYWVQEIPQQIIGVYLMTPQ